MKIKKSQIKITKKRINALLIFVFVLLIPMVLNSPLLSNINGDNNTDLTEIDPDNETKVKPLLSAPFNAQYFSSYKTITIDHTQVSGTSGLINFPFLISLFDTDLRSDVQSDGDDIAFSHNNVWLDHEIEVFDQTHNGTHAKLIVWIRLPVLSVNIDTILRMYYGNSTMSSQQNPEGVWDSSYEAVYHMNQDPSSSSVLDSTAHNYDLTPGSGFVSGDLVDGIIGKAIDFGGVNTEYLELTSGFSNPSSSLSLEMWFRPQLFSSYQRYFTARWSYPDIRLQTSNFLTTRIRNNLGNVSSTTGLFDGWSDQFYHFVMTWQGSSVGRQKHYINGTLDREDYDPEALGTHSSWSGYVIGADADYTDAIDGLIEEFRISSSARSADWFQTEYNNQYDPNTFYTVGTEQEVVWEPPNAHYFTYYKVITIDHNQISGSGIHYNFPILISFVDEDLKYHVQPNGNDIAFTTAGDWLDHEIVAFNQTYSSTQAELLVWIQIPFLYTTKDTIITMYYGNSTMSSRENPEGVWDSQYAAVYHLNDDFLDSTSNNRDGVNTGSVDVKGKIGDGQDFETDDSTDNINIGTWSVSGSQITIQCWVKFESFAIQDARILSKNSGTGNGNEDHVFMLGTWDQPPLRLRGRIKTGISDSSGTSTRVATSGDLSTDTWYLASVVYDGSDIRFVLDGNPVGTSSKTGPIRVNDWPITIGNSPAGARALDGVVDEVRVSTTVRSDDWLKTEYDNQNTPTSFGTVGEENLVNDILTNAFYFDYYKILTIDHNNVDGTGSHVNFPFLVSLLDEDLRFDVQNDGDDIAFSSNGQWLDHQIETFNQTYNATHAELIAWVRVPYLSTATDTIITMYYGNDTMSSRQNPEGVWVAYKSAWHFNEPSGTGAYIKDSTSNNYDGTPFGTQFLQSGQIDGAREFSGSGDNRIIIDRGDEFFTGDNTFTFSFWVYPNYATDVEMESVEGRVFQKQSSVRMNRFWRQNWMPPGVARYQSDIQFVTYGTTYNNVEINRLEWNYITYSYDGTYLKTYINDQLGPSTNIGGFPLIADPSSFYFGSSSSSFKGFLDEFRVSSAPRSDGWVATEYYNQYDPGTFFNISDEKYSKPVVFVDAQIKAFDLYGNLLPNVTISMYQNVDLIASDITDTTGSVNFTNVLAGDYNFTATISSIIASVSEIVNITPQAISLNDPFQTIDLICDVSTHFFEVTDIDNRPLESGWIMVGNDTHTLRQCELDSLGQTKFWWVDGPPSQYNYTIYYGDSLYDPPILALASDDITTVNTTIQVQVDLTTVDFSVVTINAPISAVSGAKLKLTVGDPSGASIVNLTTDLYGKAKLYWLDSAGIGANYSLQIEFFGVNRLFNESLGGLATTNNISFTVSSKKSIEFRIQIDLGKFQTELISLNPTDYIELKWGSLLKLRTLFNVSKVEAGYEHLLGPAYADSVSYELLLGGVTILSDIFMEEGGNVGRSSIEIDTTQISDDEKYIIIISAYKSGFSIPSDLILQLDVSERDLILNQSDNNDSVSTAYWSEDVNMTLKAYGIDSETLTLENALFQDVDHTFNFVISDVEQQWNLSAIEFNIYGISWNTDITNINITIEDPYGEFYYLITNSTHSGWDYTQGTWTGILLDLNKASHNKDNNFEFIIGGSFDGSVDIVANAYFTRDSLNVQYSKFNISNEISLLTRTEGWAISNITFEIFDCYYTSNWSTVNLSNLTDLNITTNEGFKFSLDFGYSDGTGILTIDNRIIYPIGNQFLFTVESIPDVVFNAVIKIEYIQSFYKNLILETFNITKLVQGILNGGTFQIGATEGSWNHNEVELLINTINDGSTYYFPSDVAMNITIGGQTYTIMDVAQGTGSFSLIGFSKNQILQAIIETSVPVNFSLFLSIEYLRSVSQEVTGSLSYSIVEAPSIFGTVLYDQDLNYYLKTIDTSLLDADEYTVRFSFLKSHYLPAIKDLSLDVLNRPTLLNGSSEFFRTIQNIYVNDAINFTFLFTDALRGTKITNLKSQYYIWESYDTLGNVVDTGQGSIISTLEDTYIVDFDTETRDVGEYLLVLTVEKDNYNRKNAMIILNINKRIINYTLGEPFIDFRSSIPQGNLVTIQLNLTDPTQGNIPLINATIEITIGGNTYSFNETVFGTYIYDFSTSHVNTFFTSSTLAGTINITREDYISEEFTIIIVVEMEQIFGIPTFYFILVSSAIIVVVGSIVGYKVIQNAKIPTFVKKVREMKKAIKGNKDISESVLYNKREVFVAEKVNHKWDKIGLSLSDKLDLEGQKIRKISKVERRISVASRSQESKPLGLIFMKWDERIGTEILAKYPEETVISEKTLMQIYSTHEYSGEKGVVTLSAGSLNIVSYYSGPEKPYYLVLILNLDDDPDMYEAGLPDVLRTLLDNIEDDTYIQLIPSLFQRLSLFPSLSEEEILALNYQDEIKQMIINNLRDIGVITKSELSVWLKDKFVEGFIDLEATLSEMIKREVVKQVSVKGLPSEIVVLINDYFMLRVPPVDLYENPTKNGLPSQFAKEYKSDIEKFFQDYRPSLEDNVKIVDILINPEVYLILKLLRTTIATREDLEKLRTKGVRDIYGALKLLWDAKLIKIFRDENNNEYYTLISDFYLDLIFPKYLLRAIKAAYEQKSIADKALMEYLDILEDTYYDLKSKKKK